MSVPNQRDPDLLEAVRALRAEVAELRASTVGRWGHGPQGLASQRPAAAADLDGVIYWATDTDTLSWCDGTGWIILAEPVQSHTLTVSSTWGTITTVGATSFSYTRRAGWLNFSGAIAVTTVGTGTGYVALTLPVDPLNTTSAVLGHGREFNLNGKTLQVIASGGQYLISTYDNLSPASNGCNLVFTGGYPMKSRYS